jgi:hypothetical protein
MDTPWGVAQTVRNIADGIDFVTTAGHGGFVLSPERRAEMPFELKACSFTRDRFFEEDFSWCAVPLAFPQYFTVDDFRVALETYRDGVRRGWADGNSATYRDTHHGLMIRRLERQLASMQEAAHA